MSMGMVEKLLGGVSRQIVRFDSDVEDEVESYVMLRINTLVFNNRATMVEVQDRINDKER